MTEVEWLQCSDPGVLLEFLRLRASGRKLKLFDVACARSVRHLLGDPRLHAALAEAESSADAESVRESGTAIQVAALECARGLEESAHAAEREWRLGGRDAWAVSLNPRQALGDWLEEACQRLDRLAAWQAARAALTALEGVGDHFADPHRWRFRTQAARTAALAARYEAERGALRAGAEAGLAPPDLIRQAGEKADDRHRAVRASQSECLRDLFGSSFYLVAFDASWRSATAVNLAGRMYDTGEFDAMPVLADALQDAGCEVSAVRDHCHGPGRHFRGCWVVDLVLGRQ
jgi:hypothetical protein